MSQTYKQKKRTIDFANICIEIRQNTGFTKEQMANFIGVTVRTYERYETGQVRPGAEAAFRLAGLHLTFSTKSSDF